MLIIKGFFAIRRFYELNLDRVVFIFNRTYVSFMIPKYSTVINLSRDTYVFDITEISVFPSLYVTRI